MNGDVMETQIYNRREASNTYFHMNIRCTAEASAWASSSVFMLRIMNIKSQVLSAGLILQKGKNPSSGTQILSCRDSFTCECKEDYSIGWTSRGGWAVRAGISPNYSNLSLHHPVISATLSMMFFIQKTKQKPNNRLQWIFFKISWVSSATIAMATVTYS